MIADVSDDNRRVCQGQRRPQVACHRLNQQQTSSGSSEHVYLEPEVIILPTQHSTNSGEQPHDQCGLQQYDHPYEEPEAVNLSVSRYASHTRDETSPTHRMDSVSPDHVYHVPEAVSFPLQDFSVTICCPEASTTETSFIVSPEEVYEEAEAVHLQGCGTASARNDDIPASSDSISENDGDKEGNILRDQRYHTTPRVHHACVARTTVAMVTLIIAGAVLLLSVSSWHQKQDDVTAFPLLTTATSRNMSATLGDSVAETDPDPEMTSTEPARPLSTTSFMAIKTDQTHTSTAPVPPIKRRENDLRLDIFLESHNCSKELGSAKEDGSAYTATIAGKITFGQRGSGPGEFNWPSDLVVSPSNEIFVTDVYNKRVQVFSMSGVFLRMFPAVISGTENQLMNPYYITMDSEGDLWVIGRHVIDVNRYFIMQYTACGCAKVGFTANEPGLKFFGIAVDRRSDNIIVTGFNTWSAIAVLRPDASDGTVLHVVHLEQNGHFDCVTVDDEGRIFAVHSDYVYVFNSSLGFLFRFKGIIAVDVPGRWALGGICATSSGYILITYPGSNVVKMLTRRGEFVRDVTTGVTMVGTAIATGPDGQVVLVDYDSVVILPHY